MRRLIAIAFLAFATSALAAPPGKVMHTWLSPSRTVEAQAFMESVEEPRKIYLHLANDNEHWVLLCEYGRDAGVVFAPNEAWLAVNDYELSNFAHIRLFERRAQLEYAESKLDPSGSAWALLRKLYRVPYPAGLDHAYSEALRWSPDSSAIMVRLWGHADLDRNVDDWLCVYSISSRGASVNLSILNRSSVVFKKPKK